LLPDFLMPGRAANRYWRMSLPGQEAVEFRYRLAWNPRLLRLNPHATRRRDALGDALAELMADSADCARRQHALLRK
jgi:hypothetical protein